jgi:hypothetical protein
MVRNNGDNPVNRSLPFGIGTLLVRALYPEDARGDRFIGTFSRHAPILASNVGARRKLVLEVDDES